MTRRGLWAMLFISLFSCLPANGQEATDSLAADSTVVQAEIMPADHWNGSDTGITVQSRSTNMPGGWFFLLNILFLILLGMKYVVYPEYTKRSWNAWLNDNLFFQWVREKSPVKPLLVLMEAFFKYYAIAAITCFTMALFLEQYAFNPRDLFRIMLVIAAFFLAKNFVAYLIAWLTDMDDLFRTLQINSTIFNSNLSFLFIPVIFIVAYLVSPYHSMGVYVLISLTGIAIVLLSVKSMRIIYKTHMAFNLHFFLYLCAFEILPYLLMVRLFEHEVL